MDFLLQQRKIVGRLFSSCTNQQNPVFFGGIDAAFFQAGIKIIHVGRSLVNQCFHSEMPLVCLIAADGVQFPFTDQQMCDALRQMGIFADFIGRAADADNSNQVAVVITAMKV